jgi:hypothetical protein
MMTTAHATTDLLYESLKQGDSLFGVCDAAQNHEIPFRLRKTESEFQCLYQGRDADELWYVAPYLFRCDQSSAFLRWMLDEGCGSNWGIFLAAPVSLSELCEHLRRFLIVKVDDTDRQFYFRFYDPRVLRAYLPTCTSYEATDFFGPVRCFLMETDRASPEVLKFTLDGAGTKQDVLIPKTIG